MIKRIRNIAVIAHIDHGKTTLIEKILEQSDTFKKTHKTINKIMDSNVIEKERGITILAKNTSITWNNHTINIIDTPGHADFSGEVERIISMVDSVLLIVDALEGPMPQTRFVTKKAFENNIKPIVVINKIDRKDARPDWVINEIFDLFINLNATDDQLDFKVVYTSALLGSSGTEINKIKNNMDALYNSIIKYAPYPKVKLNGHFQMQISQLDYDNYLGIIGIGKINRGIVKTNQQVAIINSKNEIKYGKINKVLKYQGINKFESESAKAGDIIAITGLNNIKISNTICDYKNIEIMKEIKIEKPTVTMFFGVNTSPFSGKEGKYITSRKILERLKKETINNIALKVEETKKNNVFSVSGRGELHISILIENMRREGFELEISRPKVILRKINNIIKEPFEDVLIEIKEKHQGIIMKIMGERKNDLKSINKSENKDRVRMHYTATSRSLIGFRSEFINITSGTGVLYSSFSHYDNLQNYNKKQRENGVLISNKEGTSIGFALFNLQNRGKLFIGPGEKVYEGQIIGIHNRNNDLTVNCLLAKKLTNMRASGSDEAINLTTPIRMSLEESLSFINDDELIEVTPNNIRLRKKYLTINARKKISKYIK
ncbi:translational GTPase TypA [Buchnera aphidicola (Neophyllaphis varicolor)]|uniref:translational GTPase TypA n=1 Tax=Buchnera aphidicola TaxID=9 RepID=UPI0031B895C0